MYPNAPVTPDPDDDRSSPGPVSDPAPPDQPDSIEAEGDAYDEADAESFPASDPPAASEPGV
jgi:hypothetical protein